MTSRLLKPPTIAWLRFVAVVALVVLDGWSLADRSSAGDESTPQKLNPYSDNAVAIKEGRALYLRSGCSGCHGVQGGGGMAVPLLDDTWKFGGDDATLFRLVKGDIAEQTMPKVWKDVLSDEEVWKIIAYVRSLYKGDPSKITW